VLARALVCGVVLAVPAPGPAEDVPQLAAQEVEGFGEAPVVGGNLVSARRRALDLARQDAVARTVAGEVPPEKLAEQQATLRGGLYKRHRLYVRSYRVLEEARDGRLFRVRVAVVLDSKRLLHDLRRLLGLKASSEPVVGRPLVCLVAQGSPGPALERALSAAGFSTRSGAGAGCGVRVAASVALEDLEGVRGVALPGAKASVRVRATLGAGADLLVEGSAQGLGAASSAVEARRIAAQRAVDRVIPELVAALERQWPRSAQQGRRVVRVSGITSLQQQETIRLFLERRVPGVRRVLPARFEQGEIWLAVAGGSPQELARSLASQDLGCGPSPTPDCKPLRLRLRSVSGGTLWLTVQ